jgi:hypothetical protein
MASRAARAIDHMHLPVIATFIGRHERADDILRRTAVPEHPQAVDAEKRICESLRRDHAGSPRAIGNDRPDRQRPRGAQHAKRAGFRIPRNDRPRHAVFPALQDAAISVFLPFSKPCSCGSQSNVRNGPVVAKKSGRHDKRAVPKTGGEHYRTLPRAGVFPLVFSGGTWANVNIRRADITGRALDLALRNQGTAAQQSVINQVIQRGAQQGVSVNVIPIR